MNIAATTFSASICIEKTQKELEYGENIKTSYINTKLYSSNCAFLQIGSISIHIRDMESLDNLIYELQKLAVDMRTNKVGLCYQEVK